MLRRRSIASAALVLATAGCGGSVSLSPPAAAPGTPAPVATTVVGASPSVRRGIFPPLAVDDLHTGGKAVLSDLIPSRTPILVWLWAPH